jgi:hypothetical protein
MAESHSAARHSAHSSFGMESGRGCCGRKGICSQQGMSGFATVADNGRPAPSTNRMKLTKSASAGMARPSQLILVFCGPSAALRWNRRLPFGV